MIKIGESPSLGGTSDFSLLNCFTGSSVTINKLTGKIGILSFIEWINGWNWLKNLVTIQQAFTTSDIYIIAIIFSKTDNSFDDSSVRSKINTDAFFPANYFNTVTNFDIAIDSAGSGSYPDDFAMIYENGITTDSNFLNAASGNKTWSYITSIDYIITDKWHTNCESFTISNAVTTSASPVITVPSTTNLNVGDSVIESGIPSNSYIISIDSATQITINQNVTAGASPVTLKIGSGDPHSFHHIKLAGDPAFNSRDFANTELFLNQRITNLRTDPVIMSTTPSASSFLKDIPTVDIVFSKLMNSAAANSDNYTLDGTGSAGLVKGAALFTGRNRIENVATLQFSTSVPTASGPLKITVEPAITDTASTPIPVTGRDINYTIDITPPSFSTFTLTSGTPTSNPNITFDFTVTDNVGVTGWIVNESSTPPSASGGGWTTVTSITPLTITGGAYSLSGGLGTKHVYAWAKDAAGNVSAVNANSHFDVVFDSELPQTTAFTRSSASPTKNPVVSFHLEGSDNIGIVQWKVTENNTKPSSGSSGWTIVAETTSLSINGTYTLTSPSTSRTQTLYVWLGDGAGNVSDENGTSHFDVVYDVTVPVVTAFTLTSANPTNNQTITFNLEANDPV